jgi:hypothetical protein
MSFEKKKKKKSSLGIQPTSPEDWECEEDLRAVARAKAVESDPDRMKKVKSLAKTKLDESMRRKEEAQRMIDLGNQAEK